MSTCPESSVYWEIAHVQKVYDLIAPHYNDIKHRTWPKVNKFLKNLAPGSLVADVGCGNGRYLSVNPMIYKFGSDICTSFLDQARVGDHEVLAADNIALPYRDGVFDAVCSIGVIHHFSSRKRRIRAIKELARITSPGGKLMIYVWAYEQTRRKFTSQDVLIPWIKPELDGCYRTKLSNMETNSNCSFDNNDSQDEQLLSNADHPNANGDCKTETGKTCREPNAFLEKISGESSYRTGESAVKLPGIEVAGIFKDACCRNGNKEICNVDELPSKNDIDERDVEWAPEETEKYLLYPKQFVSDCKKVGSLLRYLTTKNECHDPPDKVLGENDRYADSCNEVQLYSETSAVFRFNGGYSLDHNVETKKKDVCNSPITITSYLSRETSEEDSAASTMRLLEDSPSSSFLSYRSRDTDIVGGTNISERTFRASTSIDDPTAIEDLLENDLSSSSVSFDSEGSQFSTDETLAFSDSFSKSTTFDPFSRSPPEVPSNTSISESDYIYTELNSRVAVLNSNSRDEPCFQSVHYFDDPLRQKAPYNNIKPAIPLNQSFPKKNVVSNIVTENRTSAYPQNIYSVFEHYDVSDARKEITTESKPEDHYDTVKSQGSQSKRRDLLYLYAIRQNMKNLYAKFTDAYQANKKCGGGSHNKNSSLGVPTTKAQEPMTRTQREDQITLQYYREVCYFPPNNQYQSMKSCLGKNPVPSTPKLIQGRRHSLLGFTKRFSGAKDKTASQTKPALVEENRKLSLSDALTMIGDGYSEDYIEDKLDSTAKKIFLEMRKVNFGIRQFPRSSVEENHSPAEQLGSHLNTNSSLYDLKENAKPITERVVDSLQDGLKQIGHDSLRNGLIQLAGDGGENNIVQQAGVIVQNGLAQLAKNAVKKEPVELAEDTIQNGLVQLAEHTVRNCLVQLSEHTAQKDLVQLAENTFQKGLVQLAEDASQIGLAKPNPYSPFSLPQTFESLVPNRLSVTNTLKLKDDKQLVEDINLKPANVSILNEISLDISNNATDNSVGTKLKHDSVIIDTMIDISPLPVARIISHSAVSDQPPRTPPRTPELCDRKRIISSLSRYYHVFKEGELESLILDHVPSLLIVDSYYDHANWCVVAEKR